MGKRTVLFAAWLAFALACWLSVEPAATQNDLQRTGAATRLVGNGMAAYTRYIEGSGTSIDAADLAGGARRSLTRRVKGGARDDGSPSWSSDGSRVAFLRLMTAGPSEGDSFLYTVSRTGTNERLILKLGEVDAASSPVWSRDGTRIAVAGGPLWVANADGSGWSRLAADSTCQPEWSPDGRALVYMVDDFCGGRGSLRAAPGFRRIYRINPDSGARKLLARGSFGDAAWSADGTRIAYTGDCAVYHDADWFCSVYLMNADGTNKRRIIKESFGCGCVSWVGSEPRVLWNRGGLYATDLATGKTRTVMPDKNRGSPIAQSSDGSILAVNLWGEDKVILLTADGRKLGRISAPGGGWWLPAAVFLG